MRLETPFSEAFITQGTSATKEPTITYTYGQVEGIVQTLTSRGGLRFILYDRLFDKPISCYLEEGQEQLMRGAWGRRVIVSGSIGREPEEHRPVVVRHIQHVDVLEDIPSGDYRDARGAIPYEKGMEKSEIMIRRIRDAW